MCGDENKAVLSSTSLFERCLTLCFKHLLKEFQYTKKNQFKHKIQQHQLETPYKSPCKKWPHVKWWSV